MSEEIPTEVICVCGSVAIITGRDVRKNGTVYDAVYRCVDCGADTCFKPTEMQEDLMGLAALFTGDAG